MKIKREKIAAIITQLDTWATSMQIEEGKQQEALQKIHPSYRNSAANLIHYAAFRQFDLRNCQKKLRNLGLTRFANAEGHILASVQNTNFLLKRVLDAEAYPLPKSNLSIKKGRRTLTKNTKSLLGYRSKGRRVRIMVTMPNEAAYDYDLVLRMVQEGMNVARINCAHDDAEVWEKIIAQVRKAGKAVGRQIKIAMDLAGPKIRTGRIAPGPKVKKFKPERDVIGQIVKPAQLLLVPALDKFSPENALPIAPAGLEQLKMGDRFRFEDARGKIRQLKIIDSNAYGIVAHAYETSYIATGMQLQHTQDDFVLEVGDMPPVEQALMLRKGDVFTITKEAIDGKPAIINEDGELEFPAQISCQLPEVFTHIQEGQTILFDDGKIEGQIQNLKSDSFAVKVLMAKEQGSKLKAEKGINFPDTNLGISGLTQKDKEDLPFVAKHADMVNFSFVNTPEDVTELYSELTDLGALDKLGVILKIETKTAVANLKDILLTAMQSSQVGVMIARGDLAVETGWDNIGRIQEDILVLCAAAHIPVVWATQVLENLAKKGLPSRSEITDATAALHAECIMLNKGPYIHRAIGLLHTILSKNEANHEKKEVMLPKLP
ncbi:MAG: pyruvate kinase [Flavobacteriaceae bacterium]|nr:pyruvate kinase [Flavobacteriaceae bacterium]